MGLFGAKVKHQPLRASEAFAQAFADNSSGRSYNVWIAKFPLKGERDQCFVARLDLVDGKAHLVMDGVDYGPVADGATEALDAINEYGGQSCPAVLRITKPTAENYHVAVRMGGAGNR